SVESRPGQPAKTFCQQNLESGRLQHSMGCKEPIWRYLRAIRKGMLAPGGYYIIRTEKRITEVCSVVITNKRQERELKIFKTRFSLIKNSHKKKKKMSDKMMLRAPPDLQQHNKVPVSLPVVSKL
ncbi:MAG: hypothetical protein ABF468_11420, partial [Acetobacter fabarum]|uniref:hypothetical protein n=2 Tax=Acetobacter fabarum TaxID=483199 RepID=UPI001C529BFF